MAVDPTIHIARGDFLVVDVGVACDRTSRADFDLIIQSHEHAHISTHWIKSVRAVHTLLFFILDLFDFLNLIPVTVTGIEVVVPLFQTRSIDSWVIGPANLGDSRSWAPFRQRGVFGLWEEPLAGGQVRLFDGARPDREGQ